MKILCVIDSLGSGGAQRQLVNLAVGFREKGFDVSFLTYHPHDFYGKFLSEANIPVTTILESNYFRRLFKMRRFIRFGTYDVVLSFLDGPNFICEIAGFPWRKWKLIVGERSSDPNILKSFKLKAYRLFHLFADYVVANSYENIRIVKKINPLLSDKKCKVIYNMIDFEIWKPSEKYLFRKNDKLSIIVAASHQYLKNLNGLVEAINLLEEEVKSKMSIDWYGDIRDDSLEKGKIKIENYNISSIFNFYPATSQIVEKIQGADVIGLFSFYEGFPNTICEGMACSKPIICSAISDVPKVLNQESNLLFDPYNNKSISLALSHLVSLNVNMLKEIGASNRKTSLELFEKNTIISNYIKLFNFETNS